MGIACHSCGFAIMNCGNYVELRKFFDALNIPQTLGGPGGSRTHDVLSEADYESTPNVFVNNDLRLFSFRKRCKLIATDGFPGLTSQIFAERFHRVGPTLSPRRFLT